jgi:hypothetical protein
LGNLVHTLGLQWPEESRVDTGAGIVDMSFLEK